MSEEIKWSELAERWAKYRGWKIDGVWWTHPEKGMVRLDCEPEFDRSIDDLLASLPDDWLPRIEETLDHQWEGSVYLPIIDEMYTEKSDTAAHSLLLALISIVHGSGRPQVRQIRGRG